MGKVTPVGNDKFNAVIAPSSCALKFRNDASPCSVTFFPSDVFAPSGPVNVIAAFTVMTATNPIKSAIQITAILFHSNVSFTLIYHQSRVNH